MVIESNIMIDSESRQILESRDDACAAARQILRENHTRFEMIDFERYSRIAKLRWRHCASYYVLYHANSLRSAEWLLYCYAKNGGCPSEKALNSFQKVHGGTSRLEQHTNGHKWGTATVRFKRQLLLAARSKVAQAAALAICLDVRPLPFCDGQSEMLHFAQTIF